MQPLPSEDKFAIIRECEAHSAAHRHGSGITTCVLGQTQYMIKYGISKSLATRIKTQTFLYDAEPKTNKPRIPRPVQHFEDEHGKTYLVMESIKLAQIPPSELVKRIEDALRWLSEVSAPSGHVLGPLGGGCIQHGFFNEGEAPLAFKDVTAMERYMETGRKRLPTHGGVVNLVTFKGERLMFIQGNMDDSHFGVDKEGNTVMMGFGSISFLPESFGRYILLSTDKFDALPETLGLAGASNMRSMVEIAANLGKTANPSLGLDEDGKPLHIRKKRKDSGNVLVGGGKGSQLLSIHKSHISVESFSSLCHL